MNWLNIVIIILLYQTWFRILKYCPLPKNDATFTAILKTHNSMEKKLKWEKKGKEKSWQRFICQINWLLNFYPFISTSYYTAFWKSSSMLKSKSTVSQSYSEWKWIKENKKKETMTRKPCEALSSLKKVVVNRIMNNTSLWTLLFSRLVIIHSPLSYF